MKLSIAAICDTNKTLKYISLLFRKFVSLPLNYAARNICLKENRQREIIIHVTRFRKKKTRNETKRKTKYTHGTHSLLPSYILYARNFTFKFLHDRCRIHTDFIPFPYSFVCTHMHIYTRFNVIYAFFSCPCCYYLKRHSNSESERERDRERIFSIKLTIFMK